MNTAVRWYAPPLEEPAPEPVEEAPVELPRPPSLEEIQRIRDDAQREGFEEGLAQGRADGLAQAQSEMRRLSAQFEGILDNFSRPLARLENEVVAALGELAVRIAGSLVGRAYQSEPALLAELVGEAVATVGGAAREVEVRLHPDDIEALDPLLNLDASTRLVADHALTRGDLRVHAESVRIDGSLEARLRGALDAVLRRAGARA
ncbi:flagellar assembly protein FliH [Lysobacteraceae bacterium NML93-0399]|nr:flagellar assembly protein FliH [Xanthomonadaceae bacterium NML93-0399]